MHVRVAPATSTMMYVNGLADPGGPRRTCDTSTPAARAREHNSERSYHDTRVRANRAGGPRTFRCEFSDDAVGQRVAAKLREHGGANTQSCLPQTPPQRAPVTSRRCRSVGGLLRREREPSRRYAVARFAYSVRASLGRSPDAAAHAPLL